MARVSALGLLVVICVITMATAASASAAPPEFGRCLKVAKGTGVYATGNCTSAGGENKFEWTPGPPPNPQFTIGASTHGEVFSFEGSTSRAKITCSSSTGAGEILSATTIGNLTLTLTGCETSGVPCASDREASGQEGPPELHKIVWSGLTGELGVLKAAEPPLKDMIGLTVAGETAFYCGGGVVVVNVHGSGIGSIAPTNAMATKRTWHFRAVKGKQYPASFEGGPAQMFEAVVNGSSEGETITLWDELTTAEKVEINTVV